MTAKSNEGWKYKPLLTFLRTSTSRCIILLIEPKGKTVRWKKKKKRNEDAISLRLSKWSMPMLGYIGLLKTRQLHNIIYFYVCFVYIAFIFSLGSNHIALATSRHALLMKKTFEFPFNLFCGSDTLIIYCTWLSTRETIACVMKGIGWIEPLVTCILEQNQLGLVSDFEVSFYLKLKFWNPFSKSEMNCFVNKHFI